MTLAAGPSAVRKRQIHVSTMLVPRFNEYWKTRIGRISEYVTAARAAGFSVRRVQPLNERALGFWTLSNAWTREQLANVDADERTRLQRSCDEHAWLRHALASNSIQYTFVSFALDAGRK